MAVSLTPALSQRARGRWSALRATFIVTSERHRFFDYDYDNDNDKENDKDCVRCSTVL